MIDIQRKLKGLPSEELETAKAEDYVFEERVRVIDTLLTFATSSPEEECKLRVEAINALTALCCLQEGKRPRRPKLSASVIKERHLTPPSVLDPASLSDSIPIECEPTQCIFLPRLCSATHRDTSEVFPQPLRFEKALPL